MDHFDKRRPALDRQKKFKFSNLSKHFVALTETFVDSKNPEGAKHRGKMAPVCVSRSHFATRRCLRFFFTFEVCSSDCVVFAPLPPRSSWDREKLMAPLSFAQAAIEVFPIIPVWSCVLSKFFPTKPRMSPCNSFKGRSKAKQHEKDHCGFLRHSLMYWYTYNKYWTGE